MRVGWSAATNRGRADCRIVDLSKGGAGVVLDGFTRLGISQKVAVETDELGRIGAIVRWAQHPRYGVEFTRKYGGSPVLLALYDALQEA